MRRYRGAELLRTPPVALTEQGGILGDYRPEHDLKTIVSKC